MLSHKVLLAASIAFAAHDIAARAQGLPDEIQARQAADARLQANIDAEAAARSNGDAMLNVRIDAEAATRADAIEALRKSIPSSGGGGGGTVTVDCGSGGSIAQAVASGAAHIVVRGTCDGPVVIDRDDVSLVADPTGGSVQGTDPDANVVVVTGHRVTIDGLMVSGGRNGITGIGASNLALRNVSVQSTGRVGIVYTSGSSGTIDGCTSQGNARNGIVVDGSWARITNCTIQNNNVSGITVVNNGNAVIGVTATFVPAGNTIRQNTGNGISISFGGIATVAMNTITQNTGIGISLLHATAAISGGNTITGNGFGGVAATGSRVSLGDAGLGVTTVNQVSENGSPNATGGVFAGVGTSMLIRDAQIQSNNGAGLIVSLRSQVQMTGTTIRNNASDGIRLVLGAALLPLTPVSTITGNTGVGIQCFDSESSVVNTGLPTTSVSGNFGGDVSAACTSFDAPVIAPPPPPPGPVPGPVPPPLPPGT
ncbi:MAG TPA: right-handed parallel beta-helix repeat-containing protein [Burkholderiales bacterium]|jgi:hypothetical protein